MNRNIFSLKCALAASLCLMLSGCHDDGFDLYGNLESGEVMVSLDASFDSFAPLDLTRAGSSVENGNFMDDLSDLCVLVYDKDGNLMDDYPKEIPLTGLEDVGRVDADASDGKKPDDLASTKSLKFNIKLPVGSYYIVAVANLGNYENEGNGTVTLKSTYQALLNDERYIGKYSTLHDLRMMKVGWNTGNMSRNRAMLGYFNRFDDGNSPNSNSEFPLVIINRENISLRAWLRRCASKITVDFDGSALRDNVYVYIKDVKVLNLVKDCTLGFGKRTGVAGGVVDYNNVGGNKGTENTAPLMDNSEVNQVIAFGDPDKNYTEWPCITNGSPYIKVKDLEGGDPKDESKADLHTQSSPSLFFYENMQGESPYPKVSTVDPTTGLPVGSGNDKYDYDGVFYDGVPCGTYIEVTAHYISTNYDNVGDSEIKYRFMIGKNADKDCNAERNCHYKLTLKLRGNANDYDWHVDYHEEKGFDAPNPWYVSYVYNHTSMMPFKYTPPAGYELVKMEAEIIDNPWYPTLKENGESDPPGGDDATPYDLTANNRYIGNGFLALRSPMSETKSINDGTVVTDQDVLGREWDAYNEGKLGLLDNYFRGNIEGVTKIDKSKREFHISDGSDVTNTGREAYTFMKEHDSRNNVDKYTFNIPLFTREKILVKQTGYTGNNPFVAKTRTAELQLTATIRPIGGGAETTVSKTIKVVQVKRLVNPKGIYRKAGNNQDFHVVLMEREDISNPTFYKTVSDGPWRAEIIGDNNFITLNGKQTVNGATRSNIDFTIKFNKTNGKSTPNKNAIIRVLYNNYTCTHLIFVRQGYAPQDLSPSGTNFYGPGQLSTKWSTFNLIADGLPASDPRDEGSLFKFGNLSEPIDAVNNVYGDEDGDGDGDVLLQGIDGFIEQGPFRIVDTNGDLKEKRLDWSSIKHNADGFEERVNVASIRDFEQLYLTPHIQYGYGVLYADGATETQSDSKLAFGYYRELSDTKIRGMRGVFAYYYNDDEPNDTHSGRNLFFPIGRSAYGHRKEGNPPAWNGADPSERVLGKGILRYCSGRWKPAITDLVFKNTAPLFTSLYRREGAIYWADKTVSWPDYLTWNGQTENGAKDSSTKAFGLDLNYFTFDVNAISGANVSHGADACFIRCVAK